MASSQRKTHRNLTRRDARESPHPVKALQKKIETEFGAADHPTPYKRIADALRRAGIRHESVRAHLVNSLARLVELEKSGADIDPVLRALDSTLASARALPLPKRAPCLYRERANSSQDIIGFLREFWWPWIERGQLTRVLLKEYDPAAYRALAHWLFLKNKLPDDMAIPTKSQVIDRIAESTTIPSELLSKTARTLARRREKSKKRVS
jgi:hypothetical protein